MIPQDPPSVQTLWTGGGSSVILVSSTKGIIPERRDPMELCLAAAAAFLLPLLLQCWLLPL